MITSVVGRLIKKPEVAERIQIPGKHVVNFTLVENRTRGERRVSVFFNLSVVLGSDAQLDLALRLEKGTVLLFSAPRITFVRQTEKGEGEQSINLYAEAENFKIVAGVEGAPAPGVGTGAGSSGRDFFDLSPGESEAGAADATGTPVPQQRGRVQPPAVPAPNRPRPGGAGRGEEVGDLDDLDDPFAEDEPWASRPIPPTRGAAPAPSRPAAAAPQQGRAQQGQPARQEQPAQPQGPGRSAARPEAARGRRPAPPPEAEEFPELSDPFADGEA